MCAVSVMQLELRDSTVSVWAACHLPCCGLSCLSPVLLRSELAVTCPVAVWTACLYPVAVWTACHLFCCGLDWLSPVLLRSELLSLSCRGLGRRQAPRHPAQFSFVMLTREASDRGHIARSLSAASRSGQRDAASYRAPRGGPARRPQTGAQH